MLLGMKRRLNCFRIILNHESTKEKDRREKKKWLKGSRRKKDFSVESIRIRDIRDANISWNSSFFVFS